MPPAWGKFEGFPLFPNLAGGVVSKESVADTIDAVATGLGIPITHPDGQSLYGGHSLRVERGLSLEQGRT